VGHDPTPTPSPSCGIRSRSRFWALLRPISAITKRPAVNLVVDLIRLRRVLAAENCPSYFFLYPGSSSHLVVVMEAAEDGTEHMRWARPRRAARASVAVAGLESGSAGRSPDAAAPG